MTAWLRYDMTCDGEGCTATFTIGSRAATPMRLAAQALGWTTGPDPKWNRNGPLRSVDLCPACVAKAAT